MRSRSLIKTVCATVWAGTALVATGSAANAALAFYYDQASWLAAASGLQIETYSSASTESDQLRTVELPGPVITTSTTTTSTSNGGFSSIGPINFAYPTFFTSATRPTDINIFLEQPISGFEANLNIYDSLGKITLNNTLIVPAPQYTGFFGVIGELSSVDFNYSGGITDSPEFFSLSNIQVVTAAVPEPTSIVSLAGAFCLLLLVLMARRQPIP